MRANNESTVLDDADPVAGTVPLLLSVALSAPAISCDGTGLIAPCEDAGPAGSLSAFVGGSGLDAAGLISAGMAETDPPPLEAGGSVPGTASGGLAIEGKELAGAEPVATAPV